MRAPESFGGYAAISPSLWADNGRTANAVAALDPRRETRLHLSVGAREEESEDPAIIAARMVGGVRDLAHSLEGRPNWTIESCVFEGETHWSAVAPALSRALRFLFPAGL